MASRCDTKKQTSWPASIVSLTAREADSTKLASVLPCLFLGIALVRKDSWSRYLFWDRVARACAVRVGHVVVVVESLFGIGSVTQKSGCSCTLFPPGVAASVMNAIGLPDGPRLSADRLSTAIASVMPSAWYAFCRNGGSACSNGVSPLQSFPSMAARSTNPCRMA